MKKSKSSESPLILFKYGGNAMVDASLEKSVLQNMVALKESGYHIVIVHGGGPFIKDILAKVNIQSEFIGGHRKTTPEAMEYIEMALKGKVNSKLVRELNNLGQKAVGLSGTDGKTVIATKRIHKQVVDGQTQEADLGQVGDVASVDPAFIRLLLNENFIPVISCLASDASGMPYNINADMFAGHVAGSLEADQLVVLTDVDGLLRDKEDPASLIRELKLPEVHELLSEGVIKGGMIPKIESCQIALNKGARAARIINGTDPDQIQSLISDRAIGTTIIKS
jgi:acetylglutamate kinase